MPKLLDIVTPKLSIVGSYRAKHAFPFVWSYFRLIGYPFTIIDLKISAPTSPERYPAICRPNKFTTRESETATRFRATKYRRITIRIKYYVLELKICDIRHVHKIKHVIPHLKSMRRRFS